MHSIVKNSHTSEILRCKNGSDVSGVKSPFLTAQRYITVDGLWVANFVFILFSHETFNVEYK